MPSSYGMSVDRDDGIRVAQTRVVIEDVDIFDRVLQLNIEMTASGTR